MFPELTAQQDNILRYISQYIEGCGFPPSLREIANRFGFKSVTAAADHVNALEKKGAVRRQKGSSRALEVLVWLDKQYEENVAIRNIPILGRIAAGTPIFAVENLDGNIQIDSTMISAEECFALRVKGDSMIEEQIRNDDFVIIKRQSIANRGDIVAALIEDEVTLKKFFPGNNYVELVPANREMLPIRINRRDKDVRILGKMVGLIRKTP